MQALYQTAVVKRDLSQKAKLSIHQSINVPALTYGHELWVEFPLQGGWAHLWRQGKELRHAKGVWVELLLFHIKRSQLRYLGHLIRKPPGCLLVEILQACPTVRRLWPGRIIYSIWLGNIFEFPRKCWKTERKPGPLRLTQPQIRCRKWTHVYSIHLAVVYMLPFIWNLLIWVIQYPVNYL